MMPQGIENPPPHVRDPYSRAVQANLARRGGNLKLETKHAYTSCSQRFGKCRLEQFPRKQFTDSLEEAVRKKGFRAAGNGCKPVGEILGLTVQNGRRQGGARRNRAAEKPHFR